MFGMTTSSTSAARARGAAKSGPSSAAIALLGTLSRRVEVVVYFFFQGHLIILLFSSISAYYVIPKGAVLEEATEDPDAPRCHTNMPRQIEQHAPRKHRRRAHALERQSHTSGVVPAVLLLCRVDAR